MENILITGINGFIGRSLSRYLKSTVPNSTIVGTGFDKTKTPCDTADYMCYGDVRDFDFVRRIISQYEITKVFHLAAQSIVKVCAADPVSAYSTNVLGTVKLLEACRSSGSTVKSIVVSTSDKAYGHAPPPYTENTPLEPKYTYEASKTCQDIISRSFFHNYGIPVKVARCSNVYGPGDPNPSRIIPGTITRVARGESPVLYNGVGEFVRELIYVDDVAKAMFLISDKGVNGEAYCVGGAGKHKVKDVIYKILGLMDSDLEPKLEGKEANFKEINEQWIDSSKLRSLGWEPEVPLEDGLKRCIECYAPV